MKRPVRTGLTVKNDIFTITVLTVYKYPPDL